MSAGAHQMERPSLLISWVNPFPSRFIKRTIFFCNALAACCHFSIFVGSFLYQRAKPPQGIVLFINLLGKGLTPCLGDAGSIWWVPDVCWIVPSKLWPLNPDLGDWVTLLRVKLKLVYSLRRITVLFNSSRWLVYLGELVNLLKDMWHRLPSSIKNML